MEAWCIQALTIVGSWVSGLMFGFIVAQRHDKQSVKDIAVAFVLSWAIPLVLLAVALILASSGYDWLVNLLKYLQLTK